MPAIKPLGYAEAEDGESLRTIHAALEAGIRLFDTAAVYGAGNAERLLGIALKDRPDAMVISKIGMGFDEETKQVLGDETEPAAVLPAIERCLRRLQRDCIDVMLLHLNELPVEAARPLFEEMAKARKAGKIRAFGWSTDIPESAAAMAGLEGFIGIEHAMNVFIDVPSIQATVERHDLVAFIRSPLAMGVLTGKFGPGVQDGRRRHPLHRRRLAGLLRRRPGDAEVPGKARGGERAPDQRRPDLAQGALGWLLAKSPRNVPLPGARTVAQIQDSAGVLAQGPLARERYDRDRNTLAA